MFTKHVASCHPHPLSMLSRITLANLHSDLWLSAANLARLQPGEAGLLYSRACLYLPLLEVWRDIVRAPVCDCPGGEPLTAFSEPCLKAQRRDTLQTEVHPDLSDLSPLQSSQPHLSYLVLAGGH